MDHVQYIRGSHCASPLLLERKHLDCRDGWEQKE
uniref:Uncharacterized protein n=1 Tax=Arundo donax TaxID=35708 RepID=A0A0A8Y0P1_ARUDO